MGQWKNTFDGEEREFLVLLKEEKGKNNIFIV